MANERFSYGNITEQGMRRVSLHERAERGEYDPYRDDKSMRYRLEGDFSIPHLQEVLPMQELLDIKQKKGLNVILAIPTRNEGTDASGNTNIGTTIGNLWELVPAGLVDRMVVVDSNSSDDTRNICAALKVECINASDALEELNLEQHHGKGTNLALVAADHKGENELVVFCDADFNAQASQIQGVLSPLIADDQIQMSLAWMERRTHGGKSDGPSTKGGRATENAFKPIMKLYYPELDGLQQPICGLYAARGSALKESKFPTDYRIETALITHVADQYPLSKGSVHTSPFAQTFCGVKDQIGQPSEKIAAMSHQIILQAALSAHAAGREIQPYTKIVQYQTEQDGSGITVISRQEIAMNFVDMPSPTELYRRK